jgi:putative ABC transport system substrate-binding protein
MRRREVVVGALAAACSGGRARAQAVGPVIGFLSGRSRADSVAVLRQFHRGLAEAGYRERENIGVEYRWADGQYERLPALAAELVERRVAVIVSTGGTVAALAAKRATSEIPIVFVAGGDPIKLGLVASLGRPGGNLTGVSLFIAELGTKRLDILRELVPKASAIAVLVNRSNPAGMDEGGEVNARGSALGLKLEIVPAAPGELDAAFARMAALKIDAVLLANDPFLIDLRDRIATLAAEHRVPAIYFTREFVEAGGLASYGASIGDAYHTVGRYAGQILRGAKPADLPVEQPTKFELVINLKAANALGLTVPLSLQAQAHEVIE